MLRGPDSHSERFLNDMAQLTRRMNRAERQLSSGRRINAPSDAPSEIANLLSARSELGRLQQGHSNLGRVKTEVDTGEQALQHAVETLDRALVLGAQGATTVATAESRKTLAAEVGTLLGRLVGLSASQVEGRFLFSGDNDQVEPYTLDLAAANPVGAYAGASTTRLVGHPSGTRFAIARTAQQIFDSSDPASNVFQSVNRLRTALDGNDLGAIQSAIANVKTASSYLGDQLSHYGTIQNQVAEAIEFSSTQQLRLKIRLSEIEDADLTEAATELTTTRFLQQTAFAAEAKRPRTSLFDYLG